MLEAAPVRAALPEAPPIEAPRLPLSAPRALAAPRRPARVAPPPPSVNVLEYHAVLPRAVIDADPTWRADPFVMPEDRFAAQMAELKRLGYHALTVRQFAALWADPKKPLPPRTVLITFDDGYADTARLAAPIMARYGFRGTLFLIGALLGQRSPWPPNVRRPDPMLDVAEVHALLAAGWDVESHTWALHLLPEARYAAVTRAQAAADLAREDRFLASLTGAPPVAFAYPHGVGSAGLTAAVRVDYRIAFVGGDRPLTRRDDPHRLPRWIMTADSPLPWTLRP